ncbi:MAG TPA: 6-phosphogluconolactonase [Solirubrobacteraceae bacterium]
MEVAERLAAEMAAQINGGARNVVLAGGTTPMRAHELLGPLVDDWRGVHLWFGDERCVPPDDPDSNYGQAAARLQAPGATWHRMKGELGPDAGAADYAEELGDTVLDLLVLGIGPDGHTASLFPHHPLLDAEGSVVGVHDSPKPPPERITLTLPRINVARQIVLAVTGEEKRDALERVLAGPDRGTPASLLARDRLLLISDLA